MNDDTEIQLVSKLNQEVSDVLINFSDYHGKMINYLQYYTDSAFFKRRTGMSKIRKDLYVNLLKVFADKNIHYISPFPQMKIPANPNDRFGAGIREKILHSVHFKSNSAMIQRKNARSATLLSVAINEVFFDREKRCAGVRYLDPRYCYWQMSDQGDGKIGTFWYVKPISKKEAQQKYGVTPTGAPGLPFSALLEPNIHRLLDSQDWFLQVVKLTDQSRTAWVGDKIIEEPHNHMMGGLPIEITMPFDDLDTEHFGGFYLKSLVPLQAEFNQTFIHESRIARKMASPTVWGRGIFNRDWDDIKKSMQNQDGGFVGVGKQGEVGLLQVNDVNLLSERQKTILENMMRLSGFSSASFGESVGANTSGDALGMYFTPTQRFIEDQNISWISHWQSINAKILRAYYLNMTVDERLTHDGYSPRGSFEDSDGGRPVYGEGGIYTVEFTKQDIGTNYHNVVIPKPITPKNELAEKEWAIAAVREGVISLRTAHEMIGIIAPEDEVALIEEEKLNPALNPEGTQKLLQGANAIQPEQPATVGAGEDGA